MLSFIARRLAFSVPTMLIVITLSFFMMRVAPGNPFENGRRLNPDVERNIMARYGMNRPLGAQYLGYLGHALQGDLGPSLKYEGLSVNTIIVRSLPKSAIIGATSLCLAIMIAVPLGLAAGLRRNGAMDHAVTSLATLGICVPGFVTAPLLVLILASWLGWLPTAGWGGPRNLIMPVAVLTLPQIAVIARLTRAGAIEAVGSNFIRTARAKGLSRRRIVLRHILPSAILPLIGYLGPACAGVLTGSLVVEQIFALPGLGRFFVNSALQRDYPVVMGTVILYSGLILLFNLLADIAHALLDPRVKLS